MFCVKCGTEIDEEINFCYNCGQNLDMYQEKISATNEEPENDSGEYGNMVDEDSNVKFEETQSNDTVDEDSNVKFEETQSNDTVDEDSYAKIQNLTEVISKLQEENKRLTQELGKYTSSKHENFHRKSEYGRKMPKPEKDDVFTKFKKWYNE